MCVSSCGRGRLQWEEWDLCSALGATRGKGREEDSLIVSQRSVHRMQDMAYAFRRPCLGSSRSRRSAHTSRSPPSARATPQPESSHPPRSACIPPRRTSFRCTVSCCQSKRERESHVPKLAMGGGGGTRAKGPIPGLLSCTFLVQLCCTYIALGLRHLLDPHLPPTVSLLYYSTLYATPTLGWSPLPRVNSLIASTHLYPL